LQNLEQG